MTHLAILGGGSWGTALAIVLSPRFERVRLWVHEAGLAARMNLTRENDVYLPGFQLAANIEPVNALRDALDAADAVIGVMPSHHARRVFTEARPWLRPDTALVSATKGIETGSLKRMTEVIREVTGSPVVAALSGPSFAREVAAGEPAALVIASEDEAYAKLIQKAFSGPVFRLYSSRDPIGVELGGGLKNVIAIGAGICHGLGLGNNSQAALITRGLAEMTRLAVSMGAQPLTLAGLAGLGDLVLTCTGDLSRNRRLGIELAKGRPLGEILAGMKMVAEGVQTTYAALELSRRQGIEAPIVEKMDAIFAGRLPAREAIRELMERALRSEA